MWTKEKPKKDGIYWYYPAYNEYFRVDPDLHGFDIVEIYDGKLYMIGTDVAYRLSTANGWWWPVKQPDAPIDKGVIKI